MLRQTFPAPAAATLPSSGGALPCSGGALPCSGGRRPLPNPLPPFLAPAVRPPQLRPLTYPAPGDVLPFSDLRAPLL
jgi:hypothetical protein